MGKKGPWPKQSYDHKVNRYFSLHGVWPSCQLKECECGCGEYVKKNRNRYISKHQCIGRSAPNKDKPMKEEQKIKQSLAMKGKPVWNKGLKGCYTFTQTKEAVRKMVESRVKNGNNKHSEETKKKIGLAHKGKIISEETRVKMSEGNKGRKFSEESLKKRVKSRIANGPSWHSEETRKKIGLSHKGKLHSQEWKEKVSKTMLDKFKNDQTYLENWSAGCKVSPNNLELKVQGWLDSLFPHEWKYVGDFQIFIGGKCPDFMNINGQKKLIEIFGDYWHKNDDSQDRIDHFKKYGFNTLVLWEGEINSNPIKAKRQIMSFHNC
jgi:hypothetical protein